MIPVEEIRRRLEERSAEDRREAWLLIGLGVPFAVAGLLVLSFGLFLLFVLLPVRLGWGPKYFVALGVAVAAAAVDTWRRPSESWYRANYYLSDGTLATSDALTIGEGWAAGVPAMASVTDPHNWVTRGGQIANGCSNLVLGGPRNIRRGIERLRLVRRRSLPANVNAAAEFLAWLSEHAPVGETELAEALRRRPVLAPGYALAGELGFLARKTVDGRKTLGLK